ncbi:MULTISPECIES: 3'-5' exonuclease [Rodentibacter]|uniref:DNA polymerase III subunit epsilon n=2 Tax=Rodentibacter TaxID=1960084 RepID=A0A1V3JRT8_9PAST|nr:MULTISPECIES: 3'-5' exonuclease [Rodentibacter]OOF38767.1 DNA polymerase III subunit epsilon [Rodentibacter mrazii]OOF59128.1 DNA polymerase III subunit epsilon [Rodentibacter genomosp. 2]
MNSFVAIDFETANRNLSSVCSIGLVFVENRQIVDTYYRLIQPTPNFYSRFNTQIHGLTKADTDIAPPFPQIWTEIRPNLAGKALVAHNSLFDENCLKAVLQSYHLPLHDNPFFCTCRQARKMFPQLPNHKLNTVTRYLGFNLTHHHHALADAEACAYIALRIFC